MFFKKEHPMAPRGTPSMYIFYLGLDGSLHFLHIYFMKWDREHLMAQGQTPTM